MAAHPLASTRPAVLLRRVAIPLAAAVALVSIGYGTALASSHQTLATPAVSQALADGATTNDPTAAAAGWLARQLVNGDHLATTYGGVQYADQGLSIDGLFALAASGVASDSTTRIIHWLAGPDILAGYLGSTDPTFPGLSAGSTAKTMLAAQVTGQNPTSFGGVDLVARLLSFQQASGRFTDTFAANYTNALGQSIAVIALHRTGDHPTQTALGAAFLTSVQCDDGGFPIALDGPGCDSQVDATAYAVQALLAADPAGNATALTDALDWLVGKQKADGGFTDDDADNESVENSNSTGIAAQALRTAGRTAAADKAVAFLTSLRVGCAGAVANRGAVGYAAGTFDPSNATRATAQAILGLTGTGLGSLTAEGAQTGAPTLACTQTTPATTATPTPTTSAAATTAPPTTTTTTTTAAPTTTSAATALPTTGDPLRPIIFTGIALLVAGGALLVSLRLRRRTTEA